jgi:hypothetical protein
MCRNSLVTAFALAAALASPRLQAQPTVAGCPIFPSNNVWNRPVDTLPKTGNSDTLIESMGADLSLHADFGAGTGRRGETPGIPFAVVQGTQKKVKVALRYANESDPGGYPIPPNPPIEGGTNAKGDRHILILDSSDCKLYEIFSAEPTPEGGWTAGAAAIFDLRSNKLRPAGWTSSDAAGLPVFPGLVRYDEVAAGEIRHAIRFTVVRTRNQFVWPARHEASSASGPQFPPMGIRVRLRADFKTDGFALEVKVILNALKKYGMLLADNGVAWGITGTPDERWNNQHLQELAKVHGRDFEVVDTSGLMIKTDSAESK